MSKKKEDTKIKELEEKIVALDNQLKRAVADYRNLEQRVSQGRSELTNYVGAELIKKLLPILDHLEQALGGISEEERQSGWAKGVELSVKEFNQVLAQEGLEEILADGVFDPALHEAVDVVENPPLPDGSGETKDNMILKVVRKGYNLNGKVLRPAGVVVGRKQDKSNEEKSDESEIKETN